jgi:hypothetical protein
VRGGVVVDPGIGSMSFRRMAGSVSMSIWSQDWRSRFRLSDTLSRGFVGLRPPSHFSLLAQREVTKRKGTPVPRPADILSSGCARRLRGFPTARPCTDGKLAHFLCATLRASSPPPRRGTGAPLKSGALLRAEAAGVRVSALDLDLPSRFWRRAAQPGSGDRRHCLRPGMAEFGAGPRPASSAGDGPKARARVGRAFSWLLLFARALRRRSGANAVGGPEGAKGRMPGVKRSDSAAEGRRNRAKEFHSCGYESAHRRRPECKPASAETRTLPLLASARNPASCTPHPAAPPSREVTRTALPRQTKPIPTLDPR